MVQVIDSFSGEYRFLSNFWLSPIRLEVVRGVFLTFPTGEHAFVAYKVAYCPDLDTEQMMTRWQHIISTPEPGKVKRFGRTLDIDVSAWDAQCYNAMLQIQRLKYGQNPHLRDLLLATEDAMLIEGNTWGDTRWGQVDGVGSNWLGEILMQVRTELTSPARVW